MFQQLDELHRRPAPFSACTTRELWADEHISARMLAFHLDEQLDVASRNAAFLDRSADWIATHFDLGSGRRVVDFGCGPGLNAIRLARRRGHRTRLLAALHRVCPQAAEREGIAIDYQLTDYLEFESEPRFDLALLIMGDFCALGPEQRRRLLDRFRAVLAPGGAVLFDVFSLAFFAAREEGVVYGRNLMDGFWSAKPYYGFRHGFRYEQEKVLLDRYTIIEAARTRTIWNWLQCYSPEVLEQELAAAGFEVRERFGDVAGAPFDSAGTEFAVVASPG